MAEHPPAAPAAKRARHEPAESPPDPRFRSWPITEVRALEPMLQKMGLRVPAAQIDGTDGKGGGRCVSDAMVSVGSTGHGGTGSFISAEGLIITNHHVALEALQQKSTTEHDYVGDGFVAKSRAEELMGADYEAWITRACDDVSDEILKVVHAHPDALERANRVRDRKQELAKAKEEALGSKGMRCEVQEMFADKTYVLFTYERLSDIRIVYAPSGRLGNFGGETDNCDWPRHSADFTLLRAYVGPDGKSAKPSPDNVPYRPSKYFRACAAGAGEGDFVFLLGYPGFTMRYAPSCRLAYTDQVAIAQNLADYPRKLRLIEKHGVASREVALKLVKARRSIANNLKRDTGKRVMMRRLALVAAREEEERALTAAAPSAADVLRRLAEIYSSFRDTAKEDAVLEKLRGHYHGSTLLYAGHALHEACVEAKKPDGEREVGYRERNREYLTKTLVSKLAGVHLPLEEDHVTDARDAAVAAGMDGVAAALGGDAARLVATSALPALGAVGVAAAIGGNAGGVSADPFVKAAAAAYAAQVASRDRRKALFAERDKLLARLLELQKANSDETFYPDANGCLAVSAGYVEGYDAADAVRFGPVTTLAGLVEKHAEAGLAGPVAADSEFACDARLLTRCRDEPAALRTPVNICYSTDTVGGNSGSPVLNADGEFIGINFDRQKLGQMNEYKWSSRFSRSIACDVRYILWLVGDYDGAAHLVKEMTG